MCKAGKYSIKVKTCAREEMRVSDSEQRRGCRPRPDEIGGRGRSSRHRRRSMGSQQRLTSRQRSREGWRQSRMCGNAAEGARDTSRHANEAGNDNASGHYEEGGLDRDGAATPQASVMKPWRRSGGDEEVRGVQQDEACRHYDAHSNNEACGGSEDVRS